MSNEALLAQRREMRQEIEQLTHERDAALADLSQARAERDEHKTFRDVNEGLLKDAEALCRRLFTSRDAAIARAEAEAAQAGTLRKEWHKERAAHAATRAELDGYKANHNHAVAELANVARDRARVEHERDALREEVARLKVEVETLCKDMAGDPCVSTDYPRVRLQRLRAEKAEAKLGQAVAALRWADKALNRVVNNSYDETQTFVRERSCVTDVLADCDSADAGDYVRELEAVYEAAKYVQTRRIEHGRDAYAENALFDALTRLEIAKSRRGGGEGAK